MVGLNVWIAPAAFAAGEVGTGPVDLSMGTQVLQGPRDFDVPGGAGVLFDRAARWFVHQATLSTDPSERVRHYLNAARSLNNLAVWCMTRWQHADAGDTAANVLQEAERLLRERVPETGELWGGVYFNMGNLYAASGRPLEATKYLNLAASWGVGGHDAVQAVSLEAQSMPTPNNHQVELDQEPADALRGGKTQLMFWAALGDEDKVRRLISRGASVDAGDDDGDTALYYAVSVGALGPMRILLEHGANANICGANGSVLLVSSGRGWLEAMRLLIGAGADVDVRSSVGETHRVTPLMVAAGAGHDAAVRLLLDSGADRDLLDADGDAAEFYARSNGFVATAELLGTHPRRY